MIASFVRAVAEEVVRSHSDDQHVFALGRTIRIAAEHLAKAQENITNFFGEIPLNRGIEALVPFTRI